MSPESLERLETILLIARLTWERVRRIEAQLAEQAEDDEE